jgi:hypothetical protein
MRREIRCNCISVNTSHQTRVKGATLKIIPGAPHGMVSTLKDQINAELLAFFKPGKEAAA